jgi:hypothetical protein
MKNLFLYILPCLLSASVFSQKKDKAEEYPFLMKEILYLSDATGVGNLEYSENKKAGLAFVNDAAGMTKELNIPGRILGISKWNGQVLVLYVYEWHNEPIREVHAAVVNVHSTSIVTDKVIYKNPGVEGIQCLVGNTGDGDFRYLLVRTTALTGDPGKSLSSKEYRKWISTKALQVIRLSDNLDPAVQPLSSAAVNGSFISAFTDRKGTATIMAYAGGMLVAEKFGQDGGLIKKLSSSLECYDGDDDFVISSIGKYDPANDDRLVFSIRNPPPKGHKKLLTTFLFDFSAGKSFSSGTVVLDKDFSKEVTGDPQITSTKHFKDLESLTPATIDFIGDRILVCNEEQYTWSMNTRDAAMRYDSEGGILYMYDTQLHLQHRLFIDRTYETFIDLGRGYSTHVKDGKLLLFDNELAGIGKYGNYCYVADPQKGTIEKKTMEWGNVMKQYPVDIRTVFWFKKNLLVSHPSGNYFFGKHVDCYLSAVPYQP